MESYLDQIKNTLSEFGKNKIAVIGKGLSINEVELENLEDFLIINVNDSENIIHGALAFFYKPDVYKRIRQNGFNSSLYVAPSFLKIPDKKHIEVDYLVGTLRNYEDIFEYLIDDKFYLVDYLILSIVKFIISYQKNLEKDISVYFLGFDFISESGDEKRNLTADSQYDNAFLKTQESFFKNMLESFGNYFPSIRLIHVGEKNYSGETSNSFNKQYRKVPTISDASECTNSSLYRRVLSEVHNFGRVLVVAEFTNNHVGDPNRLVRMVQLAKESGADIIKIQKRDVDTFYTFEELGKPYSSPFGKTLGEYRNAVELDVNMIELLNNECIKNEIPWFASVLDWNSYEFMMQFDLPLIKLPSTISNHRNYLLKIRDNYFNDLVISTGFTDESYEKFIFSHFVKNRNLFLLQCTSSYPTPPEACQIAVVRHYAEKYQLRNQKFIPGYSSHDVGSLASMLAVAAGAKMIEKHVKLGDLDWVHFDGVAVDLFSHKFKDYVADIRKAEVICGTKDKKIHEFEHHKYQPNRLSN